MSGNKCRRQVAMAQSCAVLAIAAGEVSWDDQHQFSRSVCAVIDGHSKEDPPELLRSWENLGRRWKNLSLKTIILMHMVYISLELIEERAGYLSDVYGPDTGADIKTTKLDERIANACKP
jgi:hypothetical protein